MAKKHIKPISDEVKKLITPPDFNPTLHVPLLLEIFKKGGSYAYFCADVGIGKRTFYSWVEKYPEFKDAFDVANQTAQKWWEEYGITKGGDVDYWNYQHWSTIMRNRFGFSEHRPIRLETLKKTDPPEKQMESILDLVKNGGASGQELNYLCNLVATSMKVLELTDMKAQLDRVEVMLKNDSSSQINQNP